MTQKIKLNIFFNKLKNFFKLNFSSVNISISSKEKISFLEQLANLINSGIPIINSFTIMSLQTKNKKVKKIIEIFLKDLNKGNNIENIAKKFPRIFSSFDISIIKMGEVTGKLGESIELIKEKEEKTKELKGKIIGALIYPMVIVTLAISMIIVFMVFVIPKVQKMYKDAKVNLPSLTQTVIDIAKFMQDNIVYILLGIFIFIVGIIIFKTNKKTKIYWDHFILNIPIFGKLIRKKILAMFSGNLGLLLSRGVIINQALEISSQTLENDYYEKKIKEIIDGVSKGRELSDLMGINDISKGKENPYFPIEFSSVVRIGEQTGNMPALLLKISNKFKKEIDDIVKNLSTAIEPLVIIGVGIIVGILIMAIMLPFFNMVNVI